MNEQERNDFFEDRGTEITAFHSQVRTIRVLEEVWDEAQRQAAPTWQPIETAPEDGTWILLAAKDDREENLAVQSGFWSYTYDGWRDFRNDSCAIGGFEPTHWMPLPSAPPAPKTLSEQLSDILLEGVWDEKSTDIISRAIEQLHKQEQADD